jgi:hypothetical protein
MHSRILELDGKTGREPPGVASRRVNPALAREVAAAYLDAPTRHDPLAAAAYARLVTESNRLFELITSPDRPDPVRVFFTTCPTPYRDARELIASVTDDRVLEVATVATDGDRRHPLMDSARGEAYDRFRAVHDILGHARLRLGFDRDGEFAVWLAQERFHSPLARRALATGLHGQHSVRWTTGEVATPKAALLNADLLRRARLLSRGSAESIGDHSVEDGPRPAVAHHPAS